MGRENSQLLSIEIFPNLKLDYSGNHSPCKETDELSKFGAEYWRRQHYNMLSKSSDSVYSPSTINSMALPKAESVSDLSRNKLSSFKRTKTDKRTYLRKIPPIKQRSRIPNISKNDYSSNGAKVGSKTTELCRMSFPCTDGCARCAFTNCFGPVKVSVSQFAMPRLPRVREISDGQGRRIIPQARRKEFRGLVYNKETHSLYPPLPKGFKAVDLELNKYRRVFY